MRKVCLSGFPFGGAVLLFGGATVCRIRLSQPRRTTTCYNVHRQFGSFSTNSVCNARSAPKIGGNTSNLPKHVTLHHSRNYQNVMINFH